ncbi:MAG: response regulator [Geobacter sp.]|nr:MAG: response regulator [Geobacter sp.]
MKIIIADDSSLWRDRIRSILIEINEVFVVGEAENGTEALQIIMEKKPDLAILDIRMSGMNGIEVLKKIRELRMKVKVCMLTNYTYPLYKKRCIESGADYFLSKTEDFEKISEIITEMSEEQDSSTSIITEK